MGVEVDGLKFEQKHGKGRVRVGRVWRRADGKHLFVEWNVSISLLNDCLPAYTHGDNSDIVVTDTMKNTVYSKAKECTEVLSVEDFGIELGRHFTSLYKQLPEDQVKQIVHVRCPNSDKLLSIRDRMCKTSPTAIIKIVEKPWERVHIDGQPHEHGFKLGSEKHIAEVTVMKSVVLQVTSGIEGLALLKTTQSGFEGFIRDKYTALPETTERMVATEVSASWRYPYRSLSSIPAKPLYFSQRFFDVKKILVDTFFGPPKEGVYSPSVQATLFNMAKAVLNRFPDVASIQLRMPNLHFLPVNIRSSDKSTIVKFKDDVYMPTDEPHGTIEASLTRYQSKL